jgi:hypothetical protein
MQQRDQRKQLRIVALGVYLYSPKEAEAGAKTKDLCRQHGISDATFYN